MVEINRKQYQEIRKMDHRQMQTFFNSVYDRGKEEAAKERPALPNLDDLEEHLQNIRGVGGAKARMIAAEVRAYLESKVNEHAK